MVKQDDQRVPDRQTGELTAQEAKACVYRAQGKSKAEAFTLAFKQRRGKPKSLGEQASRLFAKQQIQARMRELLEAAKPADIISVGQSILEFQDFKRMAIEDRNHNALANYKRMEGQMLGWLKDTVGGPGESRTDDLVLIQKLAAALNLPPAAVQAGLGAPEGFTVDPVQTATGAVH